MDNTTSAPFAQLTFSLTERDTIDNAISAEYGADFADGGYFIISSGIPDFKQTGIPENHPVTCDFGTRKKPCIVVKNVTYINGRIKAPDSDTDQYCPYCKSLLHGHGDETCTLNHVPVGGAYTKLVVTRHRLRCPKKGCVYNYMPPLKFKEEGHLITKALATFIRDLLTLGFTLKEVSQVQSYIIPIFS